VSDVFVNVLTALSALDYEQVGHPVYFCFGPRNVKNDSVSVRVSKCPVRPMWSIVLHDTGSTATRRMASRSNRKWSICNKCQISVL